MRPLFRRGHLMGMAAPVYYTADMVRALPDDGNRYETVHGELLVTPAPRALHQLVVQRLLAALRDYLDRHPVGVVWQSPADISWGDDTLVQPDLFVVDTEQARTMDWAQMKTLQLVIEVSSPSTARHDRFAKRRLYQEQRIPLYWIVDADSATIDVWRPELQFPEIERERVSWQPAEAVTPLTIELNDLLKPL